MKNIYGVDDPLDRTLTFILENSGKYAELATIFGSLLDDDDINKNPDISVRLAESSHNFIRKDLLSSCFIARSLMLTSKNNFKGFNNKIKLIRKSSFGSESTKTICFNEKVNGELILEKQKILVDKQLQFDILLPPKSSFRLIINALPIDRFLL